MTHLPNENSNKFTNLANPVFDHKEPADDDCGLPESPIYSNYSKYLWKRAVNIGGVQSRNRSQKNPDPTTGVR